MVERELDGAGGDQQDFLHLVIMQRDEATRLDPLLPDGRFRRSQPGATENPRANPWDLADGKFVMGVNRHGGSIANRITVPPLN